MISEKINDKIRIAMICMLDRHEVKSGMVFDELTVADENGYQDYSFIAPFRCRGMLGDDLLLSDLDGKYYLAVSDGWGVCGSHLYGLNADIILQFESPVSIEEMEKMLSEPKKKEGTYAAMAEDLKRKRIGSILDVLKAEQTDTQNG